MRIKGPVGPYRSNPTPEEAPLSIPTLDKNCHPDYPSLPESVKVAFSPRDYASMPDEERRTLLYDLTNPEVEE